MKQMILATRNIHKMREISAILPPGCRVLSLADLPEMPEVEETGETFAENAALKARSLSAAAHDWALADDSGLCVDALGGLPGVYSARYSGSHGDDEANNRKLLDDLCKLPRVAPYTAHFSCAICLAHDGKVVAQFGGQLDGTITLEPRGCNGFGYDPLFVPVGYSCTLAELSSDEKNRISHRARALRQFIDYLAAHRVVED